MPRLMVYCPDYPDILAKRMEVRPAHIERGKPDHANGRIAYGGAMLPRAGTKARDAPLPEGSVRYAGSFMVYLLPSLHDAWRRIRDDPFYTQGLWDKDRIIVEELID